MPEFISSKPFHGIIVKYYKNLGQYHETNRAYPISQDLMKNSWLFSRDSEKLILHIDFHVTLLKTSCQWQNLVKQQSKAQRV